HELDLSGYCVVPAGLWLTGLIVFQWFSPLATICRSSGAFVRSSLLHLGRIGSQGNVRDCFHFNNQQSNDNCEWLIMLDQSSGGLSKIK
ncbi:MAG: hypothetical protein MJE63_25070, partial [Proteobacteria bacterium]|nr:hypothetical protein [Pseudomonadota bacterium]